MARNARNGVDRAADPALGSPGTARSNRGARSKHEEEDMPTIIGHHNLTKDVKHWLSSPKRKEFFGGLGIKNIRTFVDPQNPKRVAIMMDVPDMDALNKAMQSKGAADAMENDGVDPKSLVILVEQKA